MQMMRIAGMTVLLVWGTNLAFAAEPETGPNTADADRKLAAYFAAETARLRDACLTDIKTIDDWTAKQGEYRRQLFEMLGLDPLPPKTDLQTVVTGKVDHPEFTVENLHFQSRPGLYVTGNLYVPKNLTGPVPAILYVCGHGRVVKDGVSLGNKTHYQHHGAWLARHGYVCLTIDTLQLGEIEGIHHGTYREGRWWWLSRGYTPAGVEAWNCIRALDYLETRPEVDATRMGVTGRSGGGAYSWWISALDDRIQAAIPVAGITDLQNHVVDGVVTGHCDCMFMVNTYEWDYPQVAALNYPRALLISNTDRDRIFPIDGVYRTYMKVRRLYDLGGVPDNIALNITAGGHVDTQELQTHAFRWFDRHLKQSDRLLEVPATKLFPPEWLKVFDEVPADELNTRIDETFVPVAGPFEPPTSTLAWQQQYDGWMKALKEKTFRAWPSQINVDLGTGGYKLTHENLTLQVRPLVVERGVELNLYLLKRTDLAKPELAAVQILDQPRWDDFSARMSSLFPEAFPSLGFAGDADSRAVESIRNRLKNESLVMVFFAPRGVGLTRTNPDPKVHTQNLRRYYLLGQTLEGMQTWDIVQALAAITVEDVLGRIPMTVEAHGKMSAQLAYASLFSLRVERLALYDVPASHQPDGPALLNVLRILDVPQVLAMSAFRGNPLILHETDPAGFEYLTKTVDWLAAQRKTQVNPTELLQFQSVPTQR
jgi:dienelactone hydrolase